MLLCIYYVIFQLLRHYIGRITNEMFLFVKLLCYFSSEEFHWLIRNLQFSQMEQSDNQSHFYNYLIKGKNILNSILIAKNVHTLHRCQDLEVNSKVSLRFY